MNSVHTFSQPKGQQGRAVWTPCIGIRVFPGIQIGPNLVLYFTVKSGSGEGAHFCHAPHVQLLMEVPGGADYKCKRLSRGQNTGALDFGSQLGFLLAF